MQPVSSESNFLEVLQLEHESQDRLFMSKGFLVFRQDLHTMEEAL
jgi:hypothetical protein